MKKNLLYLGFWLMGIFTMLSACQKDQLARYEEQALQTNEATGKGHLKQTKTYDADVVKQWLAVQTAMLYRPSGNPFGFNPSRYLAYCGVAVYESVVGGMPAYQTLHGQLNNMPLMPATQPGVAYHWPSSAHAALSSMTKKFFSLVPAAYNAQAVNNLETELSNQYRSEAGNEVFERSWAFGLRVADSIFAWAQKDNLAWPTGAYQLPPYFPGMWQPESGAPANPYWGYNRLVVEGSLDGAITPPMAYNNTPGSAYYREMQEVYDVSRTLTQEQKLIAKYFNDANPGLPAGAHYVSTLKQVIEQFEPALDRAAFTYAKVGITMLDASTGSFKAKYQYLKERPFQFIRSQIVPTANPVWQPYLSTPAFPDYPSNHAIFSSALVQVLKSIYGNYVPFTDASYEGVMVDLGNGPQNLGARHYQSFDEMEEEISMSRLYGGIHYRFSCDEGRKQGRKTAENIERRVRFLK